MPKINKSHQKRIDLSDPARITQEELRHFVELVRIARERDRLRKDIIQRLEHGAEVESGQLTPELTLKQTRSWSKEKVAEVIGWREAQRIWNTITTTSYRRLRLKTRKGQYRY